MCYKFTGTVLNEFWKKIFPRRSMSNPWEGELHIILYWDHQLWMGRQVYAYMICMTLHSFAQLALANKSFFWKWIVTWNLDFTFWFSASKLQQPVAKHLCLAGTKERGKCSLSYRPTRDWFLCTHSNLTIAQWTAILSYCIFLFLYFPKV